MASSSLSKPRKKMYHVFLSFRGTDVRNNFLGHLYDALNSKGINAYKDDEKLRKGEEITPSLMDAIEGSHLAVVVLSENYAESVFCLRELTRVMECQELGQIIVLPVFFKVEPRVVRGQRESYGRAMARHEEKLGVGSDEVAKWRVALRSVGVLSGWHIQDADEAELVQSIVQEVSAQLYRPPLHVAKYPVGIDARVVIVEKKLERRSREVSMVGIWGRGGVGKTTIAKAVFNSLSGSFVDRCYIANVRENSSNSGGMVKLQQQFLSEVLREKDFPVYSVDEGIELIKDRLCCKKILLVLDDVDNLEQLDSLAGRCDWFGQGSRIIITTRDRHLLTCHGIDQDEIFTAEELSKAEALELFCSHAFRTNEIKGINQVIVNRILDYANGLPLALVVLGSFLCGRSEVEWQSAIKRLEKTPDKTINGLLKISFDGLEENEKEIFLDIACFLKGKRFEYVMQVLDSCGYDTILGLEVLKERCLIQLTSEMHDLLQLMAMDIARRENPNNPGMHSRLWLYDDIAEVLSCNLGTDAITGIMLMLPEPGELYVSPDAFRNMRSLRLLILHNVNLCGGPLYLPGNVRWLELHNCSIPDLGFEQGSKKLVMLDMQNSSITRLESRSASFRYLKTAKFADCKSLVQIPDLSAAPNLQTLDLTNCRGLIEVDKSVGRLMKLVNLKLGGCSGLTVFPDKLMSEALQTLNFTDCSKLRKFPEIVARMQWLYEVRMQRSGIEELPTSIENLIAVETFDLEDCKNLAAVPSSIYKLQTLERLVLKGCSRLEKFPIAPEDPIDPEISYGCPKLRHLDLSGCSLMDAEFLENAKCFPGIMSLKLSGNKIFALHLRDRRNFDYSRFEACQKMQAISISGCRNFTEEFINSRYPPEVVYRKWEIDIVSSDTTIPVWLERYGFSSQNQGQYLASIRVTRQQLMDSSSLVALGFVIGLENRNSFEVDVSFRITVGTYSYRKDFPGLKSDIMWLRTFKIGKMVNYFVQMRETGLIHVSVSFSLSTSCAKLKEFGFSIIPDTNNYQSMFHIRHEEEASLLASDFVLGPRKKRKIISRMIQILRLMKRRYFWLKRVPHIVSSPTVHSRGYRHRFVLRRQHCWSSANDWHYGKGRDGCFIRQYYSTDSGTDSEACSENMFEEGPGECSRATYNRDANWNDDDLRGDPEGMTQDLGNNGYGSVLLKEVGSGTGGQPEISTLGTKQNRNGTSQTIDSSGRNVREKVGLQWLLDEW